MAAEAIAVRLAEMTARKAGGVAAGFSVDVGRVDAKTGVGGFMMSFLMTQRGRCSTYASAWRCAGWLTA